MKDKKIGLLALSFNKAGLGMQIIAIINKNKRVERALFGIYFGKKIFIVNILFINISVY